MKEPILFFDGVCNLCNSWVDFLIRHSTSGRIYFASLQGVTAQHVVGIERSQKLKSLIFFKDGKLFEKSDAFFEILSVLGGPWKLLKILKIVPRSLRDWVYDQVASQRYNWFGKRESCRLPSMEERALFLD